MAKKDFKKIVYFDRETINNALQRENNGIVRKVQTKKIDKSLETDSVLELNASTVLGVPFLGRLKFLFSGRLSLEYLREWNNTTTVTSSDISQFKSIESTLTPFVAINLKDIQNSLTSLRVAAAFTKLIKVNNADFNFREMSDLLDDMEGYDVYDIGNSVYVRFNQTAYLSNYKRNDISMVKLDLYCIKVGAYERAEFDYIRKLNKMQSLFNLDDNQATTLADFYFGSSGTDRNKEMNTQGSSDNENTIVLYDVVCAYVSEEA